MVIWHREEDAPRLPREVGAREAVEVWIGTYPIEPGQQVSVEWRATGRSDKKVTSGKVDAQWQHNDHVGKNSYWKAKVGSFQEGDHVQYMIYGQSMDSQIGPLTYDFIVGPQKISKKKGKKS